MISFIAELLLDHRNSDVVDESLRIMRLLIDNMRKDPAEAKFRLLKYDNQILGKNFFPVIGAPELFIGILGFSLSDEGLAKQISSVARDRQESETELFQQAGSALEKVEEGLKVRRQLENDERRRLAAESLKDEIEAERRRVGAGGGGKKSADSAQATPSANQQQRPKKKIPMSQVLNYLLGKPMEGVDDD